MTNILDMRRPNCDGEDLIEIQALVWIGVCEDGTDADASQDGDQHYTPESSAECVACGHHGAVRSFELAGGCGMTKPGMRLIFGECYARRKVEETETEADARRGDPQQHRFRARLCRRNVIVDRKQRADDPRRN